jgi:hypothetical protein
MPAHEHFVSFIKVQGALNRHWESKSASAAAASPAA